MISHRWLKRLSNLYRLKRERALRRQEVAESLREQPPVRFCQLEPRRVLNASFDLAGPNLNLLNFAAGTNLDVSHSALTNSYEFALSSGTWQDSLGADTGSNLLVVLDSVLTGTLSVDSALATDISLSSNLGTLDQVLLSTQGAVSDAPGTQLQTNGALSITAGTVLIGEQLTDSYQLGELNLDTQGLTEVHAVGNLVVASADSTNDIRLFADSLDLQNVAIDGSLSAQSRTGDILVGSLVTDGDIILTAQGGSILDAQDDVLIDMDAGGVINLTADQHILAFGVDQFLEVADGSRVTARSLVGGNIQLQSLGSLELTQLITADGNMTIRAEGVLSAIDVDSSTTDSAANFINLTATGPSGNLEIHRVVAGTQNARVSLIASGNVLDGDVVGDDLDVSAKTVSIHAQTGWVGQQVGVNGSVFQETYHATAGVEILWTDSLTINAGNSAVLNPTLGTGVATLNSVNTVVISNGDLDASNIDVSGSTNVALIADADQNGSGNLMLPGNASVAGDLRIQGADVISALPLSFNASRFMLISGQAESFTINSFIPNSLVDLDSRVFGDLIVASQSDLRLVDLNGDNFSVSSSTGSVVVVTDTGAIEQLSRIASTQNLLLRASEDLISSASIVASGNLSLIAGDDVQLKSLVQTTSGGTVFIEAGNSTADGPDGILMSASSQILTAHSNAHLAAGNDGNISVQSIDVGKGSLSLVAEGSILGATASHFLIANALRLEADAVVNSNRNGLGSIGLANPTNGFPNANSLAIHAQVSRLSAISAEGIYLVNTGSVVVGTVDSVVVQRVNRDGTLSQNIARSLSDLTTTNGPIKLQAIDGGIRVTDGNANSQNGGNNSGVSTQAGDVLLQALGLNATITIDSAVRTQGGAVHVAADLNILQNSDLLVAGGVNNPARNSIVVESLSGSIVMSSVALTLTQDGNIVYSSANDTTLGQLSAGLGSVAVVAGGSILDGQLDTVSSLNGFAIQTGQARVVNIQSASSSLRSGVGIGAAGNALDVEVNQIAVSALGNAYLYETNGLVVGSVAVIDATRVHLNSTTANLSVARLDGAVSTNGHVKIETQLGQLEIASTISAQQDVLLVSGSDNVVINDRVQSQDGAISVLARQSVLQNANLSIANGNDPVRNSVLVQAIAGSIALQPATTTSTRGGNIAYLAATDVSVGVLNAGTGSILIRAGGSIFDAQADTIGHDALGFATSVVPRVENLIAASAQLVAGGRVSINGNPLDTSVDRLAINASGSVYIYETNGLTIDTVPAINTTRVHLDSTTALIAGSQLSGVTSTTGHVKVETISGPLTVASAVSAQQDVLLVSGSDNVVINDTVQSQDGAISVLARQSVLQNANLSITSGNDPIRNSVLVQALAGSITMQPLATTSTRGGNIAYLAATDVSVGVLSAGSGSVLIRAGGSILDAQADTVGHNALGFATSLVPRVENITAASAQLVAGGRVGVGGNPLDTSVDRLAINAVGNVYLYETNRLTIGSVAAIDTTRVHLDSTTALQTGSQLSGVTSTTGHAKLETISGSLTVASAVAAQQDVLLVSGSDNVVINANVQSQDGAISVLARQSVLQNANLSIATGNDPIRNSVLVQSLAGSITMQPATTTSTRGGNIAYLAAADVSVGVLNAGTGSILVRAGGNILDAQTDTVSHDALGLATSLVPRVENITASSAQLVAGGTVGISGNPLDTSVDRLAVSATGRVYVYDTNGLTIDSVTSINTTRVHLDSTTALQPGSQLSRVTSTTGHVKIETISGSLTVASAVAAQQDVLLVSGSDNVVINDTVQSQDGAIGLLARQSVQQNANLSITTGTDPIRNSVLVQAVAGSITMQPLATTSTLSGNIAYLAATDVSVGILNASTGSILVRAGGSILDSQADTVGHDALGFATSLVPRVENLTATSSQLVAGGSIGISGNPLDTSVDRLAISATGRVYVYETNGLTIDSVASIDTTRVHLDSTTALQPGSQLSGVTSTTGHAKLETISGSLTVASAVAAQQDVLLVSGSDNVVINDTVQSQDGAIGLLARQSVLQNANLSITTGNDPVRNSVLVQSLAGSITMQPLATTSTRGGNIAYLAATDVSVGVLSAGSGSVLIRAGGSILDSQADTVGHDALGFATSLVPRVENITAASAQLVAGGTVGISGNPLDTSFDRLAVSATGSVYVYETNGLTIDTVPAINTTRVHLDSTTALIAGSQLSGVTSITGHAKLETISGPLTVASAVAAQQDVLLVSGSDNVVINDTVQSQDGAISLLARQSVQQNANLSITTGNDPILNSIYARALNGSISMSPSAFSRSTAGNVVYQAAQNIALGQLNTTTGSVALQAGGVIADSQQDFVQLDQTTGFAIPNGAARVENVIASSLSIQAIRVGTNSNPIDINAQVLVIAVQENASLMETNQVTIGSVPEVRVAQNHLDSTQQVRSVSAVSGAFAANSFFNLQSLDGSIVVDSNANAGFIGGQSRGVIASADVLIAAGGSGDLIIESSIMSQQQDVWLAAGRFLVTPLLQVGGTQTAVVEADHLTAYAGANIFLPNTVVDTVELKVAGGINVLAPQQFLNHFADQAGTLILDQLQHGPTNTNPNITTPSTPISTDSFQVWQDHFRFTERFSDGYTVFLRNVGSLTLQGKNFDRSLNVTGQQPGVYLETLKPIGLANAPSDLIVSGKNTIVSTTTNQDPGIVLIADQNLVVQGSIELMTPLAIAAPKNQVLNLLALNASAYHAGLGDPQTVGPAGHSVPVTTEYVVDPIRSQTEDYRTHVNQRVLMEFGGVGESGFLTMVHYADNAFQVFQNQGDVSALAAPSEFALQPAQTNLLAIGNTTNDAALFTRSTDFTQVDRFFLQNNRDLPTDVVIRRSLDYFLFSNAQSSDPNQIIDHTSFAQEIVGVKSLGTPSLGPITPIPDGIAPPDPPTRGETAQADRPLSLILPQIELKQVKSEAIEVAIFRIGFDDRNSNGQVETTELPAFDDVLNRVDLDSKLPVSSKNAGQSPSQGEVDEVKARLLETPDQPSGAYAIIRKNADGKQEVLDVFSVRDWPEESKENGEVPEESDDETPASSDEEHKVQDKQQSDAAAPIGIENRSDASQSSNPQPPIPPNESSSSASTDDSDATESTRTKDGAAVLCTLWLLHQRHADQSSLSQNINADSSSTLRDEGIEQVSFSRQDRLRRRAKSAMAKIINQLNTNQ